MPLDKPITATYTETRGTTEKHSCQDICVGEALCFANCVNRHATITAPEKGEAMYFGQYFHSFCLRSPIIYFSKINN